MRENGDEASVSPSVGEFIRKQRQLADLSLRPMAELTKASNALSQPDRAWTPPVVVRVLRSMPTPSTFSAETLLAQTGIFHLVARRTPPPRQRSRTPRRQSGTTPTWRPPRLTVGTSGNAATPGISDRLEGTDDYAPVKARAASMTVLDRYTKCFVVAGARMGTVAKTERRP